MGYGKIASGLLIAATVWGSAFQVNAMDITHPTWNLGASIGHVSRNGKATFGFSNGAAAGTGASIERLSDAGSLYGLLFGADVRHDRILLGLGLDVNWQNTSDLQSFHMVAPAATHHGMQFDYKRGVALGAFGRLGYQVTDYAMPYLKVGAQSSRDEMTVRDDVIAGGALVAGTMNTTVNDRMTTWIFGAGLEIPTFLYNTSLRFEYDYVTPNKMMMSAGYANVKSELAYKPQEHIAKVAWVWNFQ